MKLSIKDNLKKFYLINEGWAEELEGNYSEDTLIFVGRMLQMAHPNEDVSNNPLADWIASSSKALGELPWTEPYKTKNEQAYQTILNFVKENDYSSEIINQIKSKKAVQALNFVKEEKEKAKEDKAFIQIAHLSSRGYINIIEKKNDIIWVEVLSKNFFTSSCENNSQFGIACQLSFEEGKFIGNNRRTFTLLGKQSKGDKSYYITLASISTMDGDKIFEIKQPGNAQPGAQSVGSFSGDFIANSVVDFIVNHNFLGSIYKYVDFMSPSSIPSGGQTYGGSGAFAYLVKNKPELINKLIQNNPKITDFMEVLIRNVNPNFLDLLNIDFEDLSANNPEKFFSKLNVYINVDKSKVVNILENFNFKNFIDNFGFDKLQNSIITLIEILPYDILKRNIIYRQEFINYLSSISEQKVKDILRKIRNKFDKNTKGFMEEFEFLLPIFIESLGNWAKIFNFLNVPRLDIHQNFKVDKDGIVKASVEEPVLIGGEVQRDSNGQVITRIVDKEIPEDEQILGRKLTKKFITNNKDFIKQNIPGDESEKNNFYQRMLLKNMSNQEKKEFLETNKEELIKYFDSKYKKGEGKFPGFIQFNLLKNKSTFAFPTENSPFNDSVKYFKFDKKYLKENAKKLKNYYFEKSNSSTDNKKKIDSIYAFICNAKNSDISNEEINQYIFKAFQFLVGSKNVTYNDISYFITSVLNLKNIPDIKLDYKNLVSLLELDEVKEIVKRESKKFQSTVALKYKGLKEKINSNLNESSVRKYIQKLLENNFNIK